MQTTSIANNLCRQRGAMHLPTLHLDRSNVGHLHIERNGRAVTLDEAMRLGFIVTENDTAAILTLAERFVVSRDEYSK